MLGFNPGTQPVAMKEWVTPLDPSIYAQGVANQTKKLEAQSAQDSELYNSFMNIQAIAPQDEEQLQTLKQSFEKELSGLSMGDLRNPQTKAQLSQIQSKYTNLLLKSGIPQRTHKYQKDIQEVKDLESKGKFVPAWKMKPILEAQKYIQDGNFYKDIRFNGQIQAGFDWEKAKKNIADGVPEYHNLVKGKQTNELYQGKTYDALKTNFENYVQNQPGALDDLYQQFEYTYGNKDFATQDYNNAIEQVNRLNNIKATSNNPILVKQAEEDLKYWNDFAKSVNPEISKRDAFQRYIKANAEDFARTNTNYALKESKMSDANKLYTEHDYRMKEIKAREESAIQKIQETQKLKSLAGNISDPLQRKLIEMGIEKGLGTELLNEDGSFKTNAELVAMDLKADVDKVEDKTKIKIGDKDYTKSEIIENINVGSQDFIKDYIKTFFGDTVKSIEVNGDDISYEYEGWGSVGWDKKIKKADLLKKIEEDSKIDVDI